MVILLDLARKIKKTGKMEKRCSMKHSAFTKCSRFGSTFEISFGFQASSVVAVISLGSLDAERDGP